MGRFRDMLNESTVQVKVDEKFKRGQPLSRPQGEISRFFSDIINNMIKSKEMIESYKDDADSLFDDEEKKIFWKMVLMIELLNDPSKYEKALKEINDLK